MRTLRVMPQDDSPAKQELRQRIALSNRSSLSVGREKLDAVASLLARNNVDRVQFVDNPTSYLQQHRLPVASCNFTAAVNKTAAQTSEIVACVINACVTSQICILVNCVVTNMIDSSAKVGGLLIGVDSGDQAFVQSFGGWRVLL
jgi:hypothetical protein